jgi:mRNA interferase YafQ
MLNPNYTNQFEKDLALAKKRNKDIEKLKVAIKLLINQEKLPRKYKDHNLVGNYVSRKECHLEPDWLLIYKLTTTDIIFERTGSHSDLF